VEMGPWRMKIWRAARRSARSPSGRLPVPRHASGPDADRSSWRRVSGTRAGRA
jgi:hypothetical protein